MNPQDFKTWLNNGPGRPPVSEGQITSIAINLNELFDGNEGRKEFLVWAFDQRSLKNLSNTELARLREWLGVRKDDETGEWTIRAECSTTATEVLHTLQIERGQLELFDND